MSKSYQRKLEQDAKKQLQDLQDQKQQLEKQKTDRKQLKALKKRPNRKDKQNSDFVKQIEEQIKEDKILELEKQIKEPIKIPSVHQMLQEKKMTNKSYQNLRFISDNIYKDLLS